MSTNQLGFIQTNHQFKFAKKKVKFTNLPKKFR